VPNEYIDMLINTELSWFPLSGVGYIPTNNFGERRDFYVEYMRLVGTGIEIDLNRARIELVNKFTTGPVLDIGVGAGTFLTKRGNTRGFDVDPIAAQWLRKEGLYVDPYTEDLAGFSAITCWDSLEHIQYPENLLRKITDQYLIVALPMFDDVDGVLASRHFKPREHYLYFTRRGLVKYMKAYGLNFVYESDLERDAGRDGIGCFVFRRDADALDAGVVV